MPAIRKLELQTQAVPAPGPLETRKETRRQILWSAVLQTARGPSPCLVTEISTSGARLSSGAALKPGQNVTLVVAAMGSFRGTVMWNEAGQVGLEFAR